MSTLFVGAPLALTPIADSRTPVLKAPVAVPRMVTVPASSVALKKFGLPLLKRRWTRR